MNPTTTSDFRIARRDAARARATELYTLADRYAEGTYHYSLYIHQAVQASTFASWVDSMIKAHPFTA